MAAPRRRAVGAALDEGSARLAEAGVEEPRREAERLLAFALGVGRLDLLTRPPALDDAARARWEEALARRARREPAAYVVGAAEFRSMAFHVGPGVLCPRPETEHLVEEALAAIPASRPARVVDVGTGSGCIALAFAAERPQARVLAIDRSPEALRYAAGNLRLHRLEGRVLLARGDLLDPVRGPVDLVLSNPPYVSDSDTVDPEVLHEPREAVFAGPDGLDAYRRLAPGAARVLRPGGLLLVETPGDRIDETAAILRAAGLEPGEPVADLAGKPRVLPALRP